MAHQTGQLKRKAGTEVEDMETLLSKDDMDKLKANFWRRHKINFGMLKEPADVLVSRIRRDLNSQVLPVHEVLRTKNQMASLTAKEKQKM